MTRHTSKHQRVEAVALSSILTTAGSTALLSTSTSSNSMLLEKGDYPRIKSNQGGEAAAQCPRLQSRVMYWIAVMLTLRNSGDSRERVEEDPPATECLADQLPPIFNYSNYFTTKEALCLSGLLMKRSTCEHETLGEAFIAFLTETAQEKTGKVLICTHSEMAPFLLRALRIDPTFSTDAQFKKEYKSFRREWKKRKKGPQC